MNCKRTSLTSLFVLLALAAMGSFLAGSATAQEKQVQHIPAGSHEVNVELNHSTVVHVEGNHLVVRLENGTLEAVQVPEAFRFHMGDRQLSVHELQPGMMITEKVVSTSKPMTIRTIEIKNGTIWHANPPHISIRDEDNKVHLYTVPEWAKVMIDGEETSVFNLRKGMKINTTIMTEEPAVFVERESKTTVRHPAPASRHELRKVAPQPRPTPVETRPTEPEPQPAMQRLPETASPLPLVGLVGLLSLAASFGLRLLRKSF